MNKKVFKSTQNSDKRVYLETQIRERMLANGADECTVSFLDGTCTVSVSKMYLGLGDLVSFANMKWLSELLGTEAIDLRNEFYREGCETCDYGSEHSVNFVCRKVNA